MNATTARIAQVHEAAQRAALADYVMTARAQIAEYATPEPAGKWIIEVIKLGGHVFDAIKARQPDIAFGAYAEMLAIIEFAWPEGNVSRPAMLGFAAEFTKATGFLS